jgi:hypothetical protein
MKIEESVCSETLAFKLQKPGDKPEESIRQPKQGESMKSRIIILFVFNLYNIDQFQVEVHICLGSVRSMHTINLRLSRVIRGNQVQVECVDVWRVKRRHAERSRGRLSYVLCLSVCSFVGGNTYVFNITLISTPLSFPARFFDKSILHSLLSHRHAIYNTSLLSSMFLNIAATFWPFANTPPRPGQALTPSSLG